MNQRNNLVTFTNTIGSSTYPEETTLSSAHKTPSHIQNHLQHQQPQIKQKTKKRKKKEGVEKKSKRKQKSQNKHHYDENLMNRRGSDSYKGS